MKNIEFRALRPVSSATVPRYILEDYREIIFHAARVHLDTIPFKRFLPLLTANSETMPTVINRRDWRKTRSRSRGFFVGFPMKFPGLFREDSRTPKFRTVDLDLLAPRVTVVACKLARQLLSVYRERERERERLFSRVAWHRADVNAA